VYSTVFIGIRQRQESTIPKRKKKEKQKEFLVQFACQTLFGIRFAL